MKRTIISRVNERTRRTGQQSLPVIRLERSARWSASRQTIAYAIHMQREIPYRDTNLKRTIRRFDDYEGHTSNIFLYLYDYNRRYTYTAITRTLSLAITGAYTVCVPSRCYLRLIAAIQLDCDPVRSLVL